MGAESVGLGSEETLWREGGFCWVYVVVAAGSRCSPLTCCNVLGVGSVGGLEREALPAPAGVLYSTRWPSGRLCEIGIRPNGEVATEACVTLGGRGRWCTRKGAVGEMLLVPVFTGPLV